MENIKKGEKTNDARLLKILNFALSSTISIIGIVYFILGMVNPAYKGIIMSAFGCIVLAWLFYIFQVIFRMKIQHSMHIIYNVYLFFAMVLGATIRFYDTFFWWDIFCHVIFGFIGGYFSLMIFKLTDDYDKMSTVGLCFGGFALILAMGCVWEIMEFTIDEIFKATTQHNLVTGVRDTMEDILCNSAGAILFVAVFFSFRKTGSDWGVGWFVKDFKNTIKLPKKEKALKGKESCNK